MEQKVNRIYSETYNFVYSRAKSMLKREEDVQQLIRDVYLKLIEVPHVMDGEQIYNWLAKQVYSGGAAHYRKKKVREAESLVLGENEVTAGAETDVEDTISVISGCLDELPDMYHATLCAFYYDFLPIDVIATLMDCEEGTIIDRLNYSQKYMSMVLADYYEETKVKVAFSAEAMQGALRKWAIEHCMGLAVSQVLYIDICRKSGMKSLPFMVEDDNLSGADHTATQYEVNEWEFINEQIDDYSSKRLTGKKKMEMLVKAAVAAGVLLVLVLIGVVISNTTGGDEEPTEPKIESEEEPIEEPIEDPVILPEETPTETPEPETPEGSEVDQYILPDSATRELSKSDLEGLTLEQLNLARNEIFARHGVIFGKQSLNDYFSQKSWYEPKITLEEFNENGNMSSIEQKNISLIVSVEDELYE